MSFMWITVPFWIPRCPFRMADRIATVWIAPRPVPACRASGPHPAIDVRAAANSFFFVDEDDPAQVISLLENHGPAWFGFKVYSDFLDYWK